MNRIAFIFALLWIVGFVAAVPRGATRVVRTFDFEERTLGNVEDIPMNWVKIDGPGLPHYVNGRMTTDRARSGTHSFRFDLNGGGLIYRYPSGQIPVQTGAHYRVETYVQTTVLPNAKARLTAYMTDVDCHLLPKTIRHSDVYAATAEGESWKRLAIGLASDDPSAAFIVVELELLQPAQYAATSLGKRALFAQDIHGSAWFDDVSVAQVPQVNLTTDRPGNVFRRSDTLRMRVSISDRFTEDLSAQVIVKDAEGRVVYQRSGALDANPADPIEPGQKSMSVLLPDLPPGWYEASLAMSSGGKSLGAQAMDLVRLQDNSPSITPDSRFGIIATDLPFEGWSELPEILPVLGVGRIKLALWSKAGDIQEQDSDAFDHLLESFSDLGITPTACLLDLPPSLAERVQGRAWTQLLNHDRSIWQPQLAELISRHANHLDRWQLGADGSEAFVNDPKMRKAYAAVYREFAALIQSPDLAMPWPAWYELDGELPATVALSVPPSVLPYQLPLYMQDLRGHEGHNLSLSLELLDSERYGRTAQIKDLAQRVVYALSAGATRIDFPLPFNVEREGDHLVKQPREMLMVIRTLVKTLGGATYKGKVPIADGVEAFLFDRAGQGVLVLWGRSNVEGTQSLAVNLGLHPTAVDLWGNITPLLKATGPRSAGKLQLNVGPMPIFLVDIDGAQSQLRASLAIDQPLMESSFEPHTRRIKFTNPYKTAISGTVHLRAPAGWTLSPPTFVFSLNPGESFDRELTISFPYNSFAGPKTIDCDFVMQDAGGGTFSVPLAMKLGLSDVGMESLALRDGDDIVVQQTISNYGKKPIDYTAFALLPGQARLERLITNLAPGATIIKRYRFKNVHVTAETKVRLGVKELMGVRVLNEEVGVQ